MNAQNILAESRDCLEFLLEFIDLEKIDCDLHRSGRFRGADRPEHYEEMAREIEGLRRGVGLDADMVPRSEQHAEIGSDAYYGGAVYHRDGHLHPARYLAGLVERVHAAGARIVGQAPVTGVRRDAGQLTLAIGPRRLVTDQVLVATNGYTPPALGWFRRRVIPLRSAVIATEAVEPSLISELSPKDRGFGGTSRLALYYRPSPDGTRMIFGGRAFHLDDGPLRTPEISVDNCCASFRSSKAFESRTVGPAQSPTPSTTRRTSGGMTVSTTPWVTAVQASAVPPTMATRWPGKYWAIRAAKPRSTTCPSRPVRFTAARPGSCRW